MAYYPKYKIGKSWRDYQKPSKSLGSILLSILALTGVGVAFFFILSIGVNRSERAECIKWNEWAKDYPLYYSTQWQLEQCQHHGLPLPK